MSTSSCCRKLVSINILVFLFCLPNWVWGQWEEATPLFITKDTTKQVIGKEHFTISADQRLHLIYQEIPIAGGSALFYTQREANGGWTSPTFINQDGLLVFNASLSTHPTLSDPYIAYQANQNAESEIVFAFRTLDDIWLTEQLTENNLLDISPSIKADPTGGIHICWVREQEDGEFILMYAYRASENSGWNISRIPDALPGELGEAANPILAVNDAGEVHITFRSGRITSLRISYAYLSEQEAEWEVETLPIYNSNEFEHALAIDIDGRPKVVIGGLFSNNNWRVYEQKRNEEGEWRERKVIVSSGRGGLSSFWIDEQGFTHILINVLFNSVPNGRVNYYENTSGSYRVRVLMGNGVVFSNVVNNATVVMNPAGQAFCAAYLGLTPEQQDIVVFGSENMIATSISSPIISSPISVYPNPTQQVIHIDIPANVSFTEVSLHRIDGSKVLSKRFSGNGGQAYTLDVSTVRAGIYMLQTTLDGRVIHQLMVKE